MARRRSGEEVRVSGGRAQPLPSVLPVYDPAVAKDPPRIVLPRLAAGGARWVQYRDKVSGDRHFLAVAREAAEAARDSDMLLLINDRVAVALALGSGVHLGQDDLPASTAREILGEEAVIGLSTGSLDDVLRAAALPVDYLAVGPVYGTVSKVDAGAPVGLEHVTAARALTRRPLVAIGGIDAGNAAEVTAAGADCVAVLSAILGSGDVADAVRRVAHAAERGRARSAR